MKNKLSLLGVVVLILVLLAAVITAVLRFMPQDSVSNGISIISPGKKANGKTILTYATHWTEDHQINGISENGELQSKGLQQYLDEYSQLNPEIEFEIQVIPYGEYSDKLPVLSAADVAPDIYQIYSPWGVSYANSGILDKPPAQVVTDIKKNYLSTEGVTINGEIWGIPTEINDFALLYNKKLFKEAGIVDSNGEALPPKTWAQLVENAVKLSKKDAKGNITHYGIAFSAEDWQIVDPFLALLYSNNGQYLAKDLSTSLFNSSAGVKALEAQLELFEKGATDINGNFFDFGEGKVAMVLAPPWTISGFKETFGDEFESTVAAAPFPPLRRQATHGYTWFMGVMDKSEHKKEAWNFLTWFTSEIQEDTGTTRYGDLLANTIGAIPSRKVDFESHTDAVQGSVTGVFVDQMDTAKIEPNVAQSNTIKSILLEEILSAWSENKTAQEALDTAADKVDAILEYHYR